MTGDTEITQLDQIKDCDIIVTTPEKWDSVTRHWRDNKGFMKYVKLLLIDEVHILNEKRGATLEVIVARMKSLSKEVGGIGIRFVAVSATVPNIDDIAKWLKLN